LSEPISAATIKAIAESIEKFSPKIAVTLLLMCLGAWVTGRYVPEVEEFLRHHLLWVWGAQLAAGAVCITHFGQSLYVASSKGLAKRRGKGNLIRRLQALTPEEKHILQPCLENSSRTITRRKKDRNIASLVVQGIMSSSTSDGFSTVFHVSEDAWNYILEHPEAIATPNNPRPNQTSDEWPTTF